MRLFLAVLAVFAVASAGTNPPQQIHIAYAGRDSAGESNGMAISWATMNGTTATSTVKYGTSATNLTMTATGFAVTYIEPGYHHHVVLSDLQLDSQYFYQCGDAAGGFSDVISFRTSKPADAKLPLTVAVIGDFGYSEQGHAVETYGRLRDFAANNSFDWLMHVGDISYADDAFLHDPLSFQYERVMNGWMNWMQPISSKFPHMVMPGNHESECHSPVCMLESKYRDALKNFTAYNARWRVPAEESGGKGANMWSSWNWGPAHFTAFNSETDFPGAGEEKHGDSGLLPAGGFAAPGELLRWFEADLAKANASRADRPFLIVMGHRPIYTLHDCSDDGTPTNGALVMQKTIEDLLYKYNVDMYIAGHVHAYGRSYPTYKMKAVKTYTNPGLPTYIVIGSAGCDEMSAKTKVQADATPAAGVPWAAAHDDDHFGMGLLTFEDRHTMTLKYLASDNGAVLDQVTIVKK